MGVVRAPVSVLVAQSAATTNTHTGDTNETTLVSLTLPPMGPNDQLLVESTWGRSGTAGTLTPKIKLGSTLIGGNVALTTAQFAESMMQRVANRGATNSQVFTNTAFNAGYGITTGANLTGAEETNAGATLTFTGTCANSGDTIKLDSYRVMILKG
jgi:hypothetical protein